jgi:hypothetical protein
MARFIDSVLIVLPIGQARYRRQTAPWSKDRPFPALIRLGAHLVALRRSPVYQAIHDRAAHTWVAAPEGTTQLHLS